MVDREDTPAKHAKLIIVAVILLGIVPATALAGWLYWIASESRPWMIGFGPFLAFFILVSWPIEFLLSQNRWLRQVTGGGQLHKTVVKFVPLYLLIGIVVAFSDLDHGQGMQANLNDYIFTIAFVTVCLIALELIQPVIARRWATFRQRSKRRD